MILATQRVRHRSTTCMNLLDHTIEQSIRLVGVRGRLAPQPLVLGTRRRFPGSRSSPLAGDDPLRGMSKLSLPTALVGFGNCGSFRLFTWYDYPPTALCPPTALVGCAAAVVTHFFSSPKDKTNGQRDRFEVPNWPAAWYASEMWVSYAGNLRRLTDMPAEALQFLPSRTDDLSHGSFLHHLSSVWVGRTRSIVATAVGEKAFAARNLFHIAGCPLSAPALRDPGRRRVGDPRSSGNG